MSKSMASCDSAASLASGGRSLLTTDAEENWLGREGSNLRMPESKSGALPLGDAPTARLRINQPGRGANPAKQPEGRHFCPVAGGGGHGYKGASRGEGPSFRTGSESSSAW